MTSEAKRKTRLILVLESTEKIIHNTFEILVRNIFVFLMQRFFIRYSLYVIYRYHQLLVNTDFKYLFYYDRHDQIMFRFFANLKYHRL
jgi:hypothetical protein